MKLKYTVIIEREEDEGYHVFCPTLHGCHSEGDTIEEALENIKEAIEVYIESLTAHGEPAPIESEIVIAAAEVETEAKAAASNS